MALAEHRISPKAVAATVILTVLMVVIWQLLLQRNNRDIADLVSIEADRTAASLSDHLQVRLRALDRLADRISRYPDTESEVLQADAGMYLRDFRCINEIALVSPTGQWLWTQAEESRVHGDADDVQVYRHAVQRELASLEGHAEQDGSGVHLANSITLADGSNGLVAISPLDDQRGWLAAAFSYHQLLQEVVPPGMTEMFRVQIRDGNHPLYQFPQRSDHSDARFQDTRNLPLLGESMIVQLQPRRALVRKMQPMVSHIIGVGGLALALLLGISIQVMCTARARADRLHELARQHEDQRNLFESVISSISEGVIVADIDGRFIHWNQAATRILGLPSQNVSPEQWSETYGLHHPDTGARMETEELPLMRAIRGETVPYAELLIRNNKLPSEIVISCSAAPILDSAGKRIGGVVVCHDTTQQKKAQQQLEQSHQHLLESERRFRAALECMPHPIMIHAEDGQILHVNRTWRVISGHARDEMPTVTHWLRLAVDSNDLEARRTIAQLFEQDLAPIEGMECQVRTRNGESRDWLFSSTPLGQLPDGRRIRITSAMDITDLKTAERERQQRQSLEAAVNAMEQVLAVVGHELRTPLAAIRASAEYLLDHQNVNVAETRTFTNAIHDESIRMAQLVNNLVEAARMNSGRVRWNWSEVDLISAGQDALSVVRPLVRADSVSLGIDVDDADSHLVMHGDADAIRRLIINLATNAAKNTVEGHIRVRMRRMLTSSSPQVEIVVEDSGVGIPPDTIENLGNAFVLSSGVLGADYIKGAGLGLAICKGIVAAHGGTISVQSEVNKGTRFVVLLPADLAGPVEQVDDEARIRIRRLAA